MASHIVERAAAAAKSGPVHIPRRRVTDDPLDAIVEQEFPVGAALFSTEEFDHVADRLEARAIDGPAVAGRVVDLFPPNTRGLTCLFVGAAENHWPMHSPEEFAHGEHVFLDEDGVHALLEPPEDHPLAAARGVLVGGMSGFLLWLIAVSVLLAARPR
jgi:hypothetical protein